MDTVSALDGAVSMEEATRNAKDMRALIRFDRSDTERTKLLKEVLRSAAKSASYEMEGNYKNKRGNSNTTVVVQELTASRPRKVAQEPAEDPLAVLHALETSVDLDMDSVEEIARCADPDGELLPILRDSGQRIVGLCASLRDSSAQLAAALGEEVDGQRGSSASLDQVRIVKRPDEGPNVERLRAEKAAADFIGKHAHYGELEELSRRIDKSKSYEDLRQVIPRGKGHHPALLCLTDDLLDDAAEFSKAVRKAMDVSALGVHLDHSGTFTSSGRRFFRPPALARENSPGGAAPIGSPSHRGARATEAGAKRASIVGPPAPPDRPRGNLRMSFSNSLLQGSCSLPALRPGDRSRPGDQSALKQRASKSRR